MANETIMNTPVPVEATEQKEAVVEDPMLEEATTESSPVSVTEMEKEEALPKAEPDLTEIYLTARKKAEDAEKNAFYDQRRILSWMKDRIDAAYSDNVCELLFADEEAKEAGRTFMAAWVQEHKTFEKMWSYILDKAHAEARASNQNHWGAADEVVFNWAEEYVRKDDKAEEEEKARLEAERKAKAEKAAAERKAKAAKKKAEPAPKKEAATGQADFMSMLEKPKAEKPKKEEGIQGQASFLDMLNPAPAEGGVENAE